MRLITLFIMFAVVVNARMTVCVKNVSGQGAFLSNFDDDFYTQLVGASDTGFQILKESQVSNISIDLIIKPFLRVSTDSLYLSIETVDASSDMLIDTQTKSVALGNAEEVTSLAAKALFRKEIRKRNRNLAEQNERKGLFIQSAEYYLRLFLEYKNDSSNIINAIHDGSKYCLLMQNVLDEIWKRNEIGYYNYKCAIITNPVEWEQYKQLFEKYEKVATYLIDTVNVAGLYRNKDCDRVFLRHVSEFNFDLARKDNVPDSIICHYLLNREDDFYKFLLQHTTMPYSCDLYAVNNEYLNQDRLNIVLSDALNPLYKFDAILYLSRYWRPENSQFSHSLLLSLPDKVGADLLLNNNIRNEYYAELSESFLNIKDSVKALFYYTEILKINPYDLSARAQSIEINFSQDRFTAGLAHLKFLYNNQTLMDVDNLKESLRFLSLWHITNSSVIDNNRKLQILRELQSYRAILNVTKVSCDIAELLNAMGKTQDAFDELASGMFDCVNRDDSLLTYYTSAKIAYNRKLLQKASDICDAAVTCYARGTGFSAISPDLLYLIGDIDLDYWVSQKVKPTNFEIYENVLPYYDRAYSEEKRFIVSTPRNYLNKVAELGKQLNLPDIEIKALREYIEFDPLFWAV